MAQLLVLAHIRQRLLQSKCPVKTQKRKHALFFLATREGCCLKALSFIPLLKNPALEVTYVLHAGTSMGCWLLVCLSPAWESGMNVDQLHLLSFALSPPA